MPRPLTIRPFSDTQLQAEILLAAETESRYLQLLQSIRQTLTPSTSVCVCVCVVCVGACIGVWWVYTEGGNDGFVASCNKSCNRGSNTALHRKKKVRLA